MRPGQAFCLDAIVISTSGTAGLLRIGGGGMNLCKGDADRYQTDPWHSPASLQLSFLHASQPRW